MVDPSRIHIWAWDARPFPAFPHSQEIWADGTNWITGHWLNGRLEGVPLNRLLAEILKDFGLPEASYEDVDGFVDGFVVDRPMAARAAIEQIALVHGVEAVASGGILRFAGRRSQSRLALSADDLVADRKGILVRRTRMQESEVPHEVSISFIESSVDFRSIVVASRRLAGASKREARFGLAALMPRETGQRLADITLQDNWIGRDSIEFTLKPSHLALEIGDFVSIGATGSELDYRVTTIADGLERRVGARAVQSSIYDATAGISSLSSVAAPSIAGQAFALVLDLPAADGVANNLQYIAVRANPWPGSMTVWRSDDGTNFTPVATIAQPSSVGRTLSSLPTGPLWLFDRTTRLDIELEGVSLLSVDPITALGGANSLAVRHADGSIEIVAFVTAELIGPKQYRLSNLVRGLKGSEPQAAVSIPAGAIVVLLDETITPIAVGNETLGRAFHYRLAPSDRDYSEVGAIRLDAMVPNLALLPLSPVSFRASRTTAGIRFDWIRRTRIGGDAWGDTDVPLSETSESYRLDVLSGSTVIRTVQTSAPSYLYANSDELGDFGSPQTSISACVFQISTEVGPGIPSQTMLLVN